MSTVTVMSQHEFDSMCEKAKITDENVEDMKCSAFISIIGTKDVLDSYLHEPNTEHWFKQNHPNVLNLEFDDVDKDTEFHRKKAYAMTTQQAMRLFKFINDNLDKDFYIHCRAGVSRSGAIGYFITQFYSDLYFTEQIIDYNLVNKDVLSKLKRLFLSETT